MCSYCKEPAFNSLLQEGRNVQTGLNQMPLPKGIQAINGPLKNRLHARVELSIFPQPSFSLWENYLPQLFNARGQRCAVSRDVLLYFFAEFFFLENPANFFILARFSIVEIPTRDVANQDLYNKYKPKTAP